MNYTISLNDWIEEWHDSQYADNFSDKGLEILYNNLTELNIDLSDITAIACDFVEYNSWSEFQDDYPNIDYSLQLYNQTLVLCADIDCILFHAF